MSFTLRWTEEADANFCELQAAAAASLLNREKRRKAKTSKAECLFRQIDKCVRLLADNPKHPGLKTHEYGSLDHPYKHGSKVVEAYAQNRTPGAYRLFWCYRPGKDEITVIAITPHP